MKEGRIQKNKLWNLAAVILLTGLFLLAAPLTVSAQTDAEGGEATTAEELNQVLGGVHQVSGNTLTLQEDVNLKKTIRILGVEKLTIDANGKQIVYDKDVDRGPFYGSEESVAVGCYYSPLLQDDFTPMFYISNCNLRILGNGTFSATGNMGSVLYVYDRSNVTIDNGTFQAKDGVPLMRGYDEKEMRSKVTINGGTLEGTNTSPHVDNQVAIGAGSGGQTDLVINGGKIGFIHMAYPFYYGAFNGEEPYGNHTLAINGGNILSVYSEETYATMKSGIIDNGIDIQYYSKLTLSGGTIKGTGVNVGNTVGTMTSTSTASDLNIKGGTISASGSEAIKVQSPRKNVHSTVTLSGGTITTSKKGARGISASAYADVKVTGGVIRSTSTESSSAGIYASGKDVKVTLQGTSGKPAYVKGYKYSTYKKGPAVLSVGKNTKVFTPKGSKSSYTSGQKLPKNVKGDMSVKYKK